MSSNTKTKYLGVHENFLKLMGISLTDTETIFYKVYSILILILTFSLPLTITIYITTKEDIQLKELLDNLPYIATTINAFSKLFAFYLVRKKVGKAFRLLQNKIFAENTKRGDKTEAALIQECTSYNNMQVSVLVIMVVINLLNAVTETFNSKHLHPTEPNFWYLPYGGFPLINITRSPNFEIVSFYKICIIGMLSFGYVAVTTFISGVMACISFQFKMLQNFIKTFRNYASKLETRQETVSDIKIKNLDKGNLKWRCVRETVKEIVLYHSAIIDLTVKFEEVLNLLALLDYLGLSFVIGLTSLYCVMFPVMNSRLINQFTVAVANTFLHFITAYWSHQVMVESEAVSKACFEVDFFNMDNRFQKDWMLIMNRSQKAMLFTVGKFAPLSLNTFLKVLHTACSYLMVFRQMN